MNKDPAFLLYSSDFLTGTMFMTDEQIGKYIRLLCAQHQHGGIIKKCNFNAIASADSMLREKFVETDEGFYNERLALEMKKRAEKSENLASNARIRWEKSHKCKSNAIASAAQMQIEDENRDENEDVVGLKDFEVFWKKYPKKEGKGLCRKIWAKLKPSQSLLQTMLDAIENQSKSDKWQKDGGQYIPMPSTWLNQSRWEDEVKNNGGGNGTRKSVVKEWCNERGVDLGVVRQGNDDIRSVFPALPTGKK